MALLGEEETFFGQVTLARASAAALEMSNYREPGFIPDERILAEGPRNVSDTSANDRITSLNLPTSDIFRKRVFKYRMCIAQAIKCNITIF